MRHLFLRAVTALATVGAAACSSSVSSPGVATSAEQACGDAATALCNRAQTCASFLVQTAFGDAATCITREKATCHSQINAAGTGATSAKLEACAQALAAESCDDLLTNNLPVACQIAGTLAAGSACGDDAQCATAHCKKTSGTCGVCSAFAKAGEPCPAAATSDCAPGLVCQNTGTGQDTCVPPGAAGAPCSSTQVCESSLACLMNGATGTCAAPLGAGAACDPQSQNCDFRQGLFCSATSVCAQIQVAASGGACGVSGASFAICGSNGKCSNATGGTCQAAAADGAACDAANGPNCLSPAVCVNGSCQLPDPAGCR